VARFVNWRLRAVLRSRYHGKLGNARGGQSGAQVQALQQYWRSAPRDAANVIANAKLGMR